MASITEQTFAQPNDVGENTGKFLFQGVSQGIQNGMEYAVKQRQLEAQQKQLELEKIKFQQAQEAHQLALGTRAGEFLDKASLAQDEDSRKFYTKAAVNYFNKAGLINGQDQVAVASQMVDMVTKKNTAMNVQYRNLMNEINNGQPLPANAKEMASYESLVSLFKDPAEFTKTVNDWTVKLREWREREKNAGIMAGQRQANREAGFEKAKDTNIDTLAKEIVKINNEYQGNVRQIKLAANAIDRASGPGDETFGRVFTPVLDNAKSVFREGEREGLKSAQGMTGRLEAWASKYGPGGTAKTFGSDARREWKSILSAASSASAELAAKKLEPLDAINQARNPNLKVDFNKVLSNIKPLHEAYNKYKQSQQETLPVSQAAPSRESPYERALALLMSPNGKENLALIAKSQQFQGKPITLKSLEAGLGRPLSNAEKSTLKPLGIQ